jgi:hypothetical protein
VYQWQPYRKPNQQANTCSPNKEADGTTNKEANLSSDKCTQQEAYFGANEEGDIATNSETNPLADRYTSEETY